MGLDSVCLGGIGSPDPQSRKNSLLKEYHWLQYYWLVQTTGTRQVIIAPPGEFGQDSIITSPSDDSHLVQIRVNELFRPRPGQVSHRVTKKWADFISGNDMPPFCNLLDLNVQDIKQEITILVLYEHTDWSSIHSGWPISWIFPV